MPPCMYSEICWLKDAPPVNPTNSRCAECKWRVDMLCNECKMDAKTRRWMCTWQGQVKDLNRPCTNTTMNGKAPKCYVVPTWPEDK